jgi:hypothetical protein
MHRRALTGATILEAIMDKRTTYDEPPEDERQDARYRTDATPPIDDDDEWWLPNKADVAAPDAPFRYRPGEGPSDQ